MEDEEAAVEVEAVHALGDVEVLEHLGDVLRSNAWCLHHCSFVLLLSFFLVRETRVMCFQSFVEEYSFRECVLRGNNKSFSGQERWKCCRNIRFTYKL